LKIGKLLIERNQKDTLKIEEILTLRKFGVVIPNEILHDDKVQSNAADYFATNFFEFEDEDYFDALSDFWYLFKDNGVNINENYEFITKIKGEFREILTMISNVVGYEVTNLEKLFRLKEIQELIKLPSEVIADSEIKGVLIELLNKVLKTPFFQTEPVKIVLDFIESYNSQEFAIIPGIESRIRDFLVNIGGCGEMQEISRLATLFNIPFDQLTDLKRKLVDQYINALSPNWSLVGCLGFDVEEIFKYAEPKLLFKIESCQIDDCLFIINDLALSNERVNELDEKTKFGSSVSYITYLGSLEFEKQLPLSYQKMLTAVEDNLELNEDLADYFIENLDQYYTRPWAESLTKKAVKAFVSVGNKFVFGYNHDPVWKSAEWVEKIAVLAKEQENTYEDKSGLFDVNEYENHHWRFSRKQLELAIAIEKLFHDPQNIDTLSMLGYEVNLETVAQVNQLLKDEFRDFKSGLIANSVISKFDKDALLYPKDFEQVTMVELIDNIRNFVARYMAQSPLPTSFDSDDTSKRVKQLDWNIPSIKNLIRDGLKKYRKTLEIEIPLYDKLYDEFDNLRETGRSPLAVYLGRDGIYAYIGRRAKDVSRRRRMGLNARLEAKENGEVLEINPKYLVYPRFFRDNLSTETKRRYLEQERISPDNDPLFYDTGYVGSIPEQILRIMDFPEEEFNTRIRLLSAPNHIRRITGLDTNARTDIIEFIEHNSKPEKTAVGLFEDPETGKMQVVAEPTTPEEQFEFAMIKHAITRHYWLQEQLNTKSSAYKTITTNTHKLRISKDSANLIPSGFLENPRDYLAKNGVLLKGSQGEGDYPDEEIFSFQLTDGTEVIAKRIELRKLGYAQKEFGVLIAAKRAGLKTANPVGLVTGLKAINCSYLVMEKLAGMSGRNFEDQLRTSGKYTEEKIKEILKDASLKLRTIAEEFRTSLEVDKIWELKDTVIQLNIETGTVKNVIPIDWERIEKYNPENPKQIVMLGGT